MRLELFGQRNQAICLSAHGGHHDHHLMAARLQVRDAARDILDALGAADGCAAVFLNNKCHDNLLN